MEIARPCTYVPYPPLLRVLRACAPAYLRALLLINTRLRALPIIVTRLTHLRALLLINTRLRALLIINPRLTLLHALSIINTHLGAFIPISKRLKANLHQEVLVRLSASALV